jgi:hypothetical protein
MNKLKIENEVLKNELSEFRKSNESYKFEISNLKSKIEKTKLSKKSFDFTAEEINEVNNIKKEQELEELKEEIGELNTKLESISKMKENYEKVSQDYLKRYEILEAKNEQLSMQNVEYLERIKKLELFAKYNNSVSFESTTHQAKGVSLDAVFRTESSVMEKYEKDDADAAEKYAGYMKVNLKPTKIHSTMIKRPANFSKMNMNMNINEEVELSPIPIPEKKINKQYNNIFEKFRNDPNQLSTLLLDLKNYNVVSNYSSTVSQNESEVSYSKQNSYRNDSHSHCSEKSMKRNASQDILSEYEAESNNSVNINLNNSNNEVSHSKFSGDKNNANDPYESAISYASQKELTPSGYVPPPKTAKKMSYTKEEYPSETSHYTNYKGNQSMNFSSSQSAGDYNYETQKSDYMDISESTKNVYDYSFNYNKVAVNQDVLEYNSNSYDTGSNYFGSGYDPK